MVTWQNNTTGWFNSFSPVDLIFIIKLSFIIELTDCRHFYYSRVIALPINSIDKTYLHTQHLRMTPEGFFIIERITRDDGDFIRSRTSSRKQWATSSRFVIGKFPRDRKSCCWYVSKYSKNNLYTNKLLLKYIIFISSTWIKLSWKTIR